LPFINFDEAKQSYYFYRLKCNRPGATKYMQSRGFMLWTVAFG